MRKSYSHTVSTRLSPMVVHSFHLTLLCECNNIGIKYDLQCGLIGVHIAP